MLRKSLYVLTAGGVLALGAYAIRSERNHAAQLGELQHAVDALSSQTRESAEHAAGDQMAVSMLAKAFATAAPTAAPSSTPSAPARSARRRPPPKPASEVRAEVEQKFASRPIDPTFSVTERLAAAEKVSALLPEGSTLQSLECSDVACRIETAHADSPRSDAFEQAFIQSDRPFPGRATLVRLDPDAQGRVGVIAYVGRH